VILGKLREAVCVHCGIEGEGLRLAGQEENVLDEKISKIFNPPTRKSSKPTQGPRSMIGNP